MTVLHFMYDGNPYDEKMASHGISPTCPPHHFWVSRLCHWCIFQLIFGASKNPFQTPKCFRTSYCRTNMRSSFSPAKSCHYHHWSHYENYRRAWLMFFPDEIFQAPHEYDRRSKYDTACRLDTICHPNTVITMPRTMWRTNPRPYRVYYYDMFYTGITHF